MTKEKLVEIFNKKIANARGGLDYWSTRCEVARAKLEQLKELLNELLASESEGEESEKGEK